MSRAWLLAPVLVLGLTSCSAEPRAELRGDVEAVTLAANDGDGDAVRSAVEDLLSTIRAQVANGDLDRAEGERLRAIALRVAENADLLEEEAAPSPAPTVEVEETEEPEPVVTEEPEPEPTEEPEPEPTEEPEPEPTEEPEPEETVEIEVPPVEESPESEEASYTEPTEEPAPSPQNTA